MNKLVPRLRYMNVQSIEFEELIALDVKGIALDLDNTLIDYKRNMPREIENWVQLAKEKEFKICILSNSNKVEKVKTVAEKLKIEYISFAKKPLKSGFEKACKLLELLPNEVAMVGDQVFTDVWGANNMNMVSVYVDPINRKEHWYTRWKRPIEAIILKRGNK